MTKFCEKMKIRTRVISSIRDIIEVLEEFEKANEDFEAERESSVSHLDMIDELQYEVEDREHTISVLEDDYEELKERYDGLKKLCDRMTELLESNKTELEY